MDGFYEMIFAARVSTPRSPLLGGGAGGEDKKSAPFPERFLYDGNKNYFFFPFAGAFAAFAAS